MYRAFRPHLPSTLTCFPFICFRWVRRELCITLGMFTMPKAKVSVGVERSRETSQRRWWRPWGRPPSITSKWLYSVVMFECYNVFLLSSIHIASDCLCIFRANLAIVKELGDRAAQGRTYGNLGNTYYLLGSFRQAVASHEQVGYNTKTTLLSKHIGTVFTLHWKANLLLQWKLF